MSEEPTFTSKLPAWIAGAAATITSTYALSYLGTSGTLGGLALGSMLSGAGSWLYEKHIRKAKARLAKIRAHAHAKANPHDISGTIMMNKIAADADQKIPKGIPWKKILPTAAAALIATASLVAFIELSASKPISAIVQNKPGHGSSFTGGSVSTTTPPASSTPSPAPSAYSSPSISSFSPSPSPVPSASPSITPPLPTETLPASDFPTSPTTDGSPTP
jgi:hypothetical protein